MKVVKADWELRNLGVITYEITAEHSDSVDDIISALDECSDAEYTVVKVSSDNSDISRYVSKNGFEFIETAMDLHLKISDYIDNPRFKPVTDKCSYSEMEEDDLIVLFEQIRSGIFNTDRIYLDEHFNHSMASERYINWIKDLIKAGNPAFKVLFNNEVVGFFIHKKIKEHVYDGILAGAYKGFEGSGMGYLVQWAGCQNVIDLSGKNYLGHVSMTNIGALKMLLSMGFTVSSVKYVYVRHS